MVLTLEKALFPPSNACLKDKEDREGWNGVAGATCKAHVN